MFNSDILIKEQKESNFNKNEIQINGVTIFSSSFRKRIINVLGNIDIYENKKSSDCVPDFKFPAVRWDETVYSENLNSLTDDEIKNKFQLLNKNIRQRKRHICKECFQSGKRKIAFDIPYFYSGDENWDDDIPKKGKDAELGCIGCAWYDFAEWRKHLLNVLEK